MGPARRLPIGAEVQAGGVHFRVWAPKRRRVEVTIESGPLADRRFPLARSDGYHAAHVIGVSAGTRYRFRLDGEDRLYPDPASRRQPEGPHGPSQVVDPASYRWGDEAWPGPSLRGQVLYEMHVGTFTREGTWEAARSRLTQLVDLGVTAIEVMPIAEFSGRFGWGYDGVDLFAPTRLYGAPDDARRFVDEAHRLGLAVILDVVYNHFGPDGNYLGAFSPSYTTDRFDNEWGDPINFDGDDAAPVREFFLANAAHWIAEYHFDGLRLDATQTIHDRHEAGHEHILSAVTREVRRAAGRRRTLVLAENEPQDVRLLRSSDEGGFAVDAVWNDDFHHSARVAATGRHEAYYSDYRGRPQELVSAVKRGYLFQGQRYHWQKQPRGTPTRGVGPERFVAYLQNHDQVANSGGRRLHELTSPGRLRALTALLLLGPATPLVFQGQEIAAPGRFDYFADHEAKLAPLVKKGRFAFMTQFPSLATAEAQASLADPGAETSFTGSRVDHDVRDRHPHAEVLALHRDLIALRKHDPIVAAQAAHGIDGAVLSDEAFVLRWLGARDDGGDDRLLIVNLGRELVLQPAPEPLLAPPAGGSWTMTWSSEDPRYGGQGTPPPITDERGWHIPPHAAIFFVSAAQAAQATRTSRTTRATR